MYECLVQIKPSIDDKRLLLFKPRQKLVLSQVAVFVDVNGIEQLTREFSSEILHERLEEKAARLENGWLQNISDYGLGYAINRVGSMMTMFCTDSNVADFNAAYASDQEVFSRYFWCMLDEGIYIAPSQFEGVFVSDAHTNDDIDQTIEAHAKALARSN